MRTLLKIFLLLSIPFFATAQTSTIDSLKTALQTEEKDTSRVLLLNELARAYLYSRPDTSMLLAQQGLQLARKTSFTKGEARSLNGISLVFIITGNYPRALQLSLEALKKAEIIGNQALIARILLNIGITYSSQGDYLLAVAYTKRGLAIGESIQEQRTILTGLINLGDSYEKLNLLDSALDYTIKAYELGVQQKDKAVIGVTLNNLGNIYAKLGRDTVALQNYRLALPFYKEEEDDEGLCEVYLGMAEVFQKQGTTDSSLHYAKLSLSSAQKAGFTERLMYASQFLTTYYTGIQNIDSAFSYQSVTIAAKDSLFSQEKGREIQSLSYEETVRQQRIEQAKAEAQTQIKFNMLFGGVGTLLIVAFFLFRNNRQKQNANALLMQQKAKVESTLLELKMTQAQLVQSEKMASLGELTAGIAHEIQNPLNFVNNFSEVSLELVEEIEDERDNSKEARDETLIGEILRDIKENLSKITHHGKRADAIVKGMLEHSRKSTGEKVATDLNALAEEYFRLSYHGIRAKDKSFHADFITDFDTTLPKVNVVPQDIGRVLLNVINNAFQALKNEELRIKNEEFKPLLTIITKKLSTQIEISISDNGPGIPESIQDKIFQPFFTTKPTGQGTGLGLSLSYDIVKAHGGEINVTSSESSGTEFKIYLPL